MKRSQSGAILIITLLILIVITGIGIATFAITDANSKITQNNYEHFALLSLANAVLQHGGQVLDKSRDYSCNVGYDASRNCTDTSISSIPKTCTAASSCQIWTYGQVSAQAPSGIMDNTTYGISWWNTYGSSNNIFPTQGISSQYTVHYLIEAQPYDTVNYLSTYRIIAFVTNTTTGQSLTKQKIYYAKNAYLEFVAANELQVQVGNDRTETVFYSNNTSVCNAGTTYQATNRNITLFNVKSNDTIYLTLAWKKFTNYSPVQSPSYLWSNCPGATIQGVYYRYYMPGMVGQVTWNSRTLDTSVFDDNPAVSELNHFKSVYPKYTVQATLLNSNYTWWATNYGLGATIPGTAKWLFPEMRSLWVMPDTTTGVTTQAAATTYCSGINSNILAANTYLASTYTAYNFAYTYRYSWVSNSNTAAIIHSPGGPQYWNPASGALGAWCYGIDQNIYLPTQTGVVGSDRRWPIESYYPPDQAYTNYILKVQFGAPYVPL